MALLARTCDQSGTCIGSNKVSWKILLNSVTYTYCAFMTLEARRQKEESSAVDGVSAPRASSKAVRNYGIVSSLLHHILLSMCKISNAVQFEYLTNQTYQFVCEEPESKKIQQEEHKSNVSKMNILQKLLLSVVCFQTCLSYHVLMYHNFGKKSHIIQFEPLVKELLERGHEVTTCFFHPLQLKHANYTEIMVPNVMDTIQKSRSKVILKEGGQSVWNFRFILSEIKTWSDIVDDIALMPINVGEIDSLMKIDKKVDVLVTMAWELPGVFLADHFDCPILYYLPVGPVSFMLQGTGNVDNLSIQPLLTARYIEPMDFFSRVLNHMEDKLRRIFLSWIHNRITSALQKKFGPKIRHPYDILKDRFSITIGGNHPVTHGSWPHLPNMIQVGAMHLRDPKSLPEDLQRFMDSASDGVVFVSLGSYFAPSQMPKEKLDVFLETFNSLNVSVLWKWDTEVPNIPMNVKTKSWVPQQDVLGHHNLKVFVTHGGLGSLQEAIYHKAVIIGIPFSNDQTPNILRAARHGYAKMLHWDNITSAELINAINDAMYDKNMKLSLDKTHSLYTDTEHNPREKAAWWVEYVCRHKGAEILQSHYLEEASWYQYHHVDLIIFIVTVIFAIISILILICKIGCTRKIKIE